MSDKSTVEVLREARELISDPERWARGYYAYDADGEMCEPEDEKAVCWCGVGALLRVGHAGFSSPAYKILENAAGATDGFPAFNDGTPGNGHRRRRPAPARHKKVLAAFDKAIALAEAKS